jgi:hypothetical protein
VTVRVDNGASVPAEEESVVKPARIVALVVGILLLFPGFGLLVGGVGLGLGYSIGRGSDGFFDVNLDRFATSTVAITAEDLSFTAEPGSPDWVLDLLDTDLRLRVTSGSSANAVFVGIARADDVAHYLEGVAHEQVIELDGPRSPVYRQRAGGNDVPAPTAQPFWVASASGIGTQELVWPASSGRWAVVVMNADGSPGVVADVNVGVRAGFVIPLAVTMFVVGAVLTAAGVTLIVIGAMGARERERNGANAPVPAGGTPTPLPPPTLPG